jgi:glyoxylase-like metal-dependent hydrolase (beta-lactamase superfamily II)
VEYSVINDGWIKIPAEDFSVKSVGTKQGRLLIGLNQLFIRLAGKNILIDTGLGDKRDFTELGLIDYQRPRMLLHGLHDIGIEPEDIDIVILTHLHYDHSGGCTARLEDGSLAKTFTNALYYVQEKELEFAFNPDSGYQNDYDPDDFKLLVDSGQLIVINGECKVVSGLSVCLAPGHSPGHQVVIATEGGETVFFPGDLIPVREHANLTISTKYDQNKNDLLWHRKIWLEKAIANKWKCVFCHAVKDQIDILS